MNGFLYVTCNAILSQYNILYTTVITAHSLFIPLISVVFFNGFTNSIIAPRWKRWKSSSNFTFESRLYVLVNCRIQWHMYLIFNKVILNSFLKVNPFLSPFKFWKVNRWSQNPKKLLHWKRPSTLKQLLAVNDVPVKLKYKGEGWLITKET